MNDELNNIGKLTAEYFGQEEELLLTLNSRRGQVCVCQYKVYLASV